MTTRLSSLHPYPAMIADSLAEKIAEEFVNGGMRVLDPFCGTGRTLLAAAQKGANCVGVDTNPLACLLVEAKSAHYNLSDIVRIINETERIIYHNKKLIDFDFERGRKVKWFSNNTKYELADIIELLNSKRRHKSTKLLAGAVLSATAREVSYCRNDRWKLHRITASERRKSRQSAKSVFLRRLRTITSEIRELHPLPGSCRSIIGDSKQINTLLTDELESGAFDVIITSPPYGDSRTTVQYGGISNICLGVISYITGLEYLYRTGGEIDSVCLGGSRNIEAESLCLARKNFSQYWRGGKTNKSAFKVYQYLYDLQEVCKQINSVLRKGGYAVIIVGRRRVGNWRLYLDNFVEDTLTKLGYKLISKQSRVIDKKILPYRVQPYARYKNVNDITKSRVLTMAEEFVLVFEKG